MTIKLTKALKEQRKKTEQFKRPIWGTLGIKLNGFRLVDVPNRPSFVYVQLEDNPNENIQAFNNKVAPSYGLPVILKRDGNRYVIIDVDTARYQNNWPNNAPFLPRHGPTHSFDPDTGGGADMVWVFPKQFMPLLVYPSGTNNGPNVIISPHVLLTSSGTFNYVGGTGTANLTPYLPTGGGAIMALVYLDKNTGNPGLIINSGSNFSSLFTTAAQVTPFIPALTSPATQIPLGAVRLVTGTTILDWSYIYDVRQFVSAQVTGTSGGGGGGSSVDTIGFAGLYEGVPLGTGTFLNVRGNTVSFTKSGSMFDLFVTGSTGGGTVNPPVTGTVVVQNDGQTLGSVTTLNFRDTLYAYVSGTVAEVLISGTSSTYMRVGQPISLSSVTGQYWIVPDHVYATGSLSVFNQGHDLIPGIDYAEQYANSGTFQYISTPPTGTYNLVIYGVPATGGGSSSSSVGITQSYLGYNTIGGSTDTPVINNKVYAKKITLSTDKLLTSIGAYVGTAGGTAMGPSVAVYTDNSGPDKLIAGVPSSGILINPSSGFRWVELPVGVWLTAGDYWIAVRTTDLGGAVVCQMKYDSGGSDKAGNMGANAWYDWSNVGSVSTTANRYSIRANVIS